MAADRPRQHKSTLKRPSAQADKAQTPSARFVAATVLTRVVADGAYASRALDAELSRAQLAERDARLATEIVYGTLRALPALDAILDRHLSRGRPDTFTLCALRAATYEARHLARVPGFAIVQETVQVIKDKRGQGLGKLANAVLRRVIEERGEPAPLARLVVPDFVEALLVEGLGAERAERMLKLDGRPPPLSLRVRKDIDRAALIERLRAARPDAELCASALLTHCISSLGVGDPRKLPGFAQGEFVVQDEGAQLVTALAGASPGQRVLDACAGHGGKTLALAEAVGPTGHVVAVDLHEQKLAQLETERARLGLPASSVSTEAIDLARGDGGLAADFDLALVDAPCSGLGTLRRRPELLLRLRAEDPLRMSELQRQILRRAASLVRVGGSVVFAVCSATATEGARLADRVERELPWLERDPSPPAGLTLASDPDGIFRIGPWFSGALPRPDVYQVVRWRVLDRSSCPV